jgi:putative ABC transport system substrate-binding protein
MRRLVFLTPKNGISALTKFFSAGKAQKITSNLLILITLVTLLPSLAHAYEVLVLQSRRDAASDAVLKGFHNGNNPSERTIVLSDYAEVDIVRIVREERPRVILAVGDAALTIARKVQYTPVLAVMTLGVNNPKAAQANLTGIGMFTPAQSNIALFKQMKVRRVGVIYNPARSGWYLQLATQAAEAAGIELVVREVSAPRDTIETLSTLAGKVDALWMLPDNIAVTRESTEAYFHFGQQQAVPVVSFAPNYLGLGAAAVFEIDWTALGRQADEMVAEILSGKNIKSMPIGFPKVIKLKTNPKVLKQFNPSIIASDFLLQ